MYLYDLLSIMNRIILCLLFVTVLMGCKKKETQDQSKKDEKIITDYIAANKLDARATGSGLYYVISTEGTGKQPASNSNVIVRYKGYLTDGTVFDQSNASGYVTSLTQVIKGWQEGIPYFKKGGSGKLLIPSALGYGSQAVSRIPANSVLIFDIDLLEVN
jgi:FKBP-type peptidyl-prolyl cis-trans isomerase FkpA